MTYGFEKMTLTLSDTDAIANRALSLRGYIGDPQRPWGGSYHSETRSESPAALYPIGTFHGLPTFREAFVPAAPAGDQR